MLGDDLLRSIIVPNVVLVLVGGGLYIAYLAYFLRRIDRNGTRGFPKWVWGLIVALGYPLGGLLYIAAGAGSKR